MFVLASLESLNDFLRKSSGLASGFSDQSETTCRTTNHVQSRNQQFEPHEMKVLRDRVDVAKKFRVKVLEPLF